MLTDTSRMPFGIHKDKQLKNVPAKHLLFLLENNICYGELKDYIVARKEKLKQEVRQDNQMKYR